MHVERRVLKADFMFSFQTPHLSGTAFGRARQDVYSASRDAFRAASWQLEDHVQRRIDDTSVV